MNSNTTQQNWPNVKAKIRTKWLKFNDIEIERFRDHLERLPEQIQKAYGVTKEQAEKEFNEFKSSLTANSSGKASLVDSDEEDKSDAMTSEGGRSSAM